MFATALPQVQPAPSAAPAPAPAPQPAASGNDPDSFARMLDAAEARRQAQTRQPAEAPPAESAEARPATTPTSKAPEPKAASAEAEPATAGAQDANEGPGEGLQAEPIDTATAESPLLAELAPGADAAALLAGLAALPRPAPTEAGARGVPGTRAAAQTSVEAPEGHGTAEPLRLLADGVGQPSGANRPGGPRPSGDAAGTSENGFAPLMRKAMAFDGATQRTAELGAQRPQAAAQPAAEARVAATDAAAATAAVLATAASPGVAGANAGATLSGPAHAQLTAMPGSPEFATQLGAQLTTYVSEGVQHARLELHPLELGPVTVQIELDGSMAKVNLAAEQAATRQALEQAMPTLAGSLREAGLTLSGGGVFEQPSQPQTGGGASGSRSRGGRGERVDPAATGTDGVLTPMPPAAIRQRGVVDLVA